MGEKGEQQEYRGSRKKSGLGTRTTTHSRKKDRWNRERQEAKRETVGGGGKRNGVDRGKQMWEYSDKGKVKRRAAKDRQKESVGANKDREKQRSVECDRNLHRG